MVGSSLLGFEVFGFIVGFVGIWRGGGVEKGMGVDRYGFCVLRGVRFCIVLGRCYCYYFVF